MKNLYRVAGFLLFCLTTINVHAEEAKTLMLKLFVSDNTYSLVDAWLVPRAFPASATLGKASEGALSWSIVSASGVILEKGILPDPQIVRAHLAESEKLSLNQARVEKAIVIIRVPYNTDMQKLSVERAPIFYLPLANADGVKKMKKINTQKQEFSIVPREFK